MRGPRPRIPAIAMSGTNGEKGIYCRRSVATERHSKYHHFRFKSACYIRLWQLPHIAVQERLRGIGVHASKYSSIALCNAS